MRNALVASVDGTAIAVTSFGNGPDVILVGGSLADRAAYTPLARQLAKRFTVHVMERRGRGASGPQGDRYGLESEIEDLLAVQRSTGATAVFGHSFGGLVCLEAARESPAFRRIAVYEPGVCIDGSMPLEWMSLYRLRLDAGDRRGAFAAMVRGAGFAPAALKMLPLLYTRLILRVVVRGSEWRVIESLLEANLAEHEVIASIRDAPARYEGVEAHVTILIGGKTPAFAGGDVADALRSSIRSCATIRLDGLDHLAPSHGAPAALVGALTDALSA